MSSLVLFEPTKIDNVYYGDASPIWRLDVFGPIQRCIDKGFKQNDIVVDVILSSAKQEQINATGIGAISSLLLYNKLQSYYQEVNGL